MGVYSLDIYTYEWVGDREEGKRVLSVSWNSWHHISNRPVALRPNENDVERFGISTSQILMLTHSANTRCDTESVCVIAYKVCTV